MPLSQQAGYYCNVCDCVLRDSQSYLDHINGGWLAGSAGGSTGGGWARCAVVQAVVAPAAPVACSLHASSPFAGLAAALAACHVQHPSLNWGVSLSVAAKPSGKWHNRALGMSMRVEKSTAEQVCLASKQPQRACSINLCAASASRPFPPMCMFCCHRCDSGWRQQKSERTAAAAARQISHPMVRNHVSTSVAPS